MPRILFWFVIVFLILFRFESLASKFTDGQIVNLEGQVLADPYKSTKFQTVEIGNIESILPIEPDVNYGDFVKLTGLYKDKKIYADTVEIRPSEFVLFVFRQKLLSFYNKSLPQPHSSLVSGMVLGAKRQIDYDFYNRLRLTGTSHIVVASGMNVVIIAFFFLNFFQLFLNRKHALVAGLISVWIYVLIAGFEAPLVRAGIMSSLTLGAKRLGRISQTLRILVITAGVMLIYNPFWIWDLGFQLSFLATLSLIIFQNKIDQKISFMPNIIRTDLSTTLAAQIGVTPLLLITFGKISLVSPIVNTLILWTVPLISIGGIVVGLVGVAFEPLGRILMLLLYPLAWWFVTIVNIFS